MGEVEVGRIEVWVGLDVGKQDHHATALSASGGQLFERAVPNDETAIEQLLDRAGELGPRLDHPVARALLARYPTPTALRAAGRRRQTPLAKRHAPRLGARLVERRAALATEIEQVFTSHPAGSSPRSVTSTDSQPPGTSPPTPAWRPSPAHPVFR